MSPIENALARWKEPRDGCGRCRDDAAHRAKYPHCVPQETLPLAAPLWSEAAGVDGDEFAWIWQRAYLDAHDPLDPLEATAIGSHQAARATVVVGECLAGHRSCE